MIFSNLPVDVINIILEYDGRIKHRRGKYMTQIPKNDPRIELCERTLKYMTFCSPDGSYDFWFPFYKMADGLVQVCVFIMIKYITRWLIHMVIYYIRKWKITP